MCCVVFWNHVIDNFGTEMRIVKAVIGVLFSLLLVFLGNNRIGQLPPIVKFIDPFHGFWQNTANTQKADNSFAVEGLRQSSSVIVDERGVPHVFAENTHDLYFLQGYLTAKDRLWQMEFQTHAAAGRLSEIVGPKALEFDLEQRRIGMGWAAELAMEQIGEDTISMTVLYAYAEGVNQYISELDENTLPLEYKLLDYKPESWSPYKSSLLLKYMAKMLTGTERDRPNTAAKELLGDALFEELFPDQNYLTDPIVPGFLPEIQEEPTAEEEFSTASVIWDKGDIQPHFVGSNNWAVSGKRTASGSPILCNDPHLRLSLPSIWYEIQLHSKDVNCYGVSLPGAPGITIGFNDSVAWGVTNAGRDVRDYYRIQFADPTTGEYIIGDKTYTANKRVETIGVRGEEPVEEIVWYTEYGPVAYSDAEKNEHLAIRWLAHDPSNELMCFYRLNRAKNFEDYKQALSYYQCPGQNFAFASAAGDIAIWQQGKFKIKPEKYGRFILDGSEVGHLEERFIPQEHNPHMHNPERGFVSSANQPSTDSTYPYYYSGVYEEFRNRTINQALREDSTVTVDDMKALQLNNYNMLAEEALPIMLSLLDTSRFLNEEFDQLALEELRAWNYSNDRGIIAPTVFEIWWDELNNILWDEFNSMEWDQDMYYRYSWEELMQNGKHKVDMRDSRYVYPMAKVTINLLENQQDHIVFDHHATNNKTENAADAVNDAFYWTVMKFGDIIKYKFNRPHWGHYQGTEVKHLMRLDAFSSGKLFVGGSENAPNATTSTHGPSWRMVVEMLPSGPVGWGVLPGGQSGNPGSPLYDGSLDEWAEGNYHRLHLISNPEYLSSIQVEEGWSLKKYEPLKQ